MASVPTDLLVVQGVVGVGGHDSAAGEGGALAGRWQANVAQRLLLIEKRRGRPSRTGTRVRPGHVFRSVWVQGSICR